MHVIKQSFSHSSPMQLHILFFTKFIAEKHLSTVVVVIGKIKAIFTSIPLDIPYAR